tara:strand:- start:170 stop:346 length:177 start_codon:yes stop_codon:yes gene_type:complete
MKVKELINRLNQLDMEKELVLYVLDNGNLFHTEIETILDVDGRIELTVYSPADMEEKE